MDDEQIDRLIEQTSKLTTTAIDRIKASLDGLAKQSKETSGKGALGGLETTLGGINKQILGGGLAGVGLVAGLYQVSTALAKTAESSVLMQAFSRNTGMANENIKDMQLQMRMMGKSTAEANGAISSINGMLNDLSTYKEESSLAKTMFGREGGAAFINRLTSAKDRIGQIDEILKTYRAGDERQKRGLADVFTGGDVDVLDRLVTKSSMIRLAFSVNADDMRKYHEQTVLFEHNISESWKAISGNVITALNRMTGGIDGSAATFESAVSRINSATNEFFSDSDRIAAKIRGTIEEIKTIKESIDAISGDDPAKGKQGARNLFGFIPFAGQSPIGAWADLTPYELLSGERYETPPNEAIAPNSMGAKPRRAPYRDYRLPGFRGDKRSDNQTGTSGATDFSSVHRSRSIEEEQSKTLIDIRDILQRMEGKDGTTYGRDYGTGTRSDGSMNAGGGGFRPPRISGDGGAFGRTMRGSDGGGSIGRTMRGVLGGGAGGSDGMDPGDGSTSATTRSGSIGAISPDSPGARFLAEQRAPFGRELDENPETRELLGAIISAENPGAGPGVAESLMNRTQLVNADRARRGLPPLSLRDMIVGHPSIGGGKSFYNPMRNGKINEHLRKMRTDPAFAARMNELTRQALSGSNVVQGHTDQGSEGDPNFVRGGEGVNIRGGRYVPPGTRGAERFNDWGYRGSRSFREQLQRGYEDAGRDAINARRRMEESRGNNNGTKSSLGVGIDFRNVPPGVTTSVTRDGDVFEELKVSTSRQNQVAGGSTGEPFTGVW